MGEYPVDEKPKFGSFLSAKITGPQIIWIIIYYLYYYPYNTQRKLNNAYRKFLRKLTVIQLITNTQLTLKTSLLKTMETNIFAVL